MKGNPAKKIAFCGMLTALAMIFSYVEALVPISIGIPGIKLGLANLVVLTALYYMRPHEVLLVSAARILLMGVLFGNGMSVIYSLAGGLLSFLVMLILIKAGGFSMIGVSIAGAVSHNTGQILAAAFVLQSFSVFYYLPVLIIAGIITGFLIGILSKRISDILGNRLTSDL